MCGRFTLTRPNTEIAEEFGLPEVPGWRPRYNVAPTQQVLAVRKMEAGRVAALLRWGLVPPWSASLAGAALLINARAETVAQKPAFRAALKKRRCLIPADGFYEWKTDGRNKLPHLFSLIDGGLLALAGLWEAWEKDGERVESVCLLTTEANEVVQAAHDRMPVILPPEARKLWLDPVCDLGVVQSLLCPYPASAMQCRRVGAAVNSVRNEGPECLEAPAPIQRSLF
jgi:putative SOS response-associated peptidase YedK